MRAGDRETNVLDYSLIETKVLDSPGQLIKAKLVSWLRTKTKYDPIYLMEIKGFGPYQLVRRAMEELAREGKIEKKRAWPVYFKVRDKIYI